MLPDGITVYTELKSYSGKTNKDIARWAINQLRKKRMSSLSVRSWQVFMMGITKDKMPFEWVCCEQFRTAWYMEYKNSDITMGQIDKILRKYF